jgi:hypothetical protein
VLALKHDGTFTKSIRVPAKWLSVCLNPHGLEEIDRDSGLSGLPEDHFRFACDSVPAGAEFPAVSTTPGEIGDINYSPHVSITNAQVVSEKGLRLKSPGAAL